MRLDVHVYHHIDPPDCEDPLADIRNAIRHLTERIDHMATEIETLTAAVDRNTVLDSSIIQMLDGIAAQLAAMASTATDLAALKAAVVAKSTELEASSDAIAAAIVAHTPAAP